MTGGGPLRVQRPPRLRALVLAGLGSVFMGACAAPATSPATTSAQATGAAGTANPSPGSSMNTRATPATAPSSGATASACNADTVQDLVGKHASSLIAEGARQRAGAARVRMIGHDDMVTKEFDAGRLNLQLDPQGKVARIYCG